jgi:hypothetical protein
MKLFIKKLFILFVFILVLLAASGIKSFGVSSSLNYYLEKKLNHAIELIHLRDYQGAISELMDVYSMAPKGKYGELSYLYIAKAYAYENYYSANIKGVQNAIVMLNMYPFYYKVPSYIALQREIIGDIYLLLGDFNKATGVFMILSSKYPNVNKYKIKLAYATLRNHDKNGIDYIKSVQNKDIKTPEDTALYYFDYAIYYFLTGDYKNTTFMLHEASNYDSFLSYHPYYEFLYGYAFYKLSDWQDAMFHLELSKRRDIYGRYKNKVNYILMHIYLITKDYLDAHRILKEFLKHDGVFYNPVAYISFSSLWMHPGYLATYKIPFYQNTLDKLMWLHFPSVLSLYPDFGLLNYYLEGELNSEEIQDMFIGFLNIKFPNRPINFDDINVSFEKPINYISNLISRENPYDETFAYRLYSVYKEDPSLFAMFLQPSTYENISRVFVYVGDTNGLGFTNGIQDQNIKTFLQGEFYIEQGDIKNGVAALNSVLNNLKGDDKEEAEFLIGYYTNDDTMLDRFLSHKNIYKSNRLKDYAKLGLLKDGILKLNKKDYKNALNYFKTYIEIYNKTKDDTYWWALYKAAYISHLLKDKNELKYILGLAKNSQNLWAKAAIVLWGE